MLDAVKRALEDRLAELDRQHAVALERNNPTVHPLAIAIRHEEVRNALRIVADAQSGRI